eukprot:1118771-Ditylum_brightwellii.AAC.1
MGSCQDAGDSLKQFIDDVGIPECIVTDSATEFVGKNTDFVQKERKMRMYLCYSEQGSDLCYWIVTASGKLISKTTVQHVTREEALEEGVKRQTEEFNSKLADRLHYSNFTADHVGYLVNMDLDEIANLVSNKGVVTHEETTVPD